MGGMTFGCSWKQIVGLGSASAFAYVVTMLMVSTAVFGTGCELGPIEMSGPTIPESDAEVLTQSNPADNTPTTSGATVPEDENSGAAATTDTDLDGIPETEVGVIQDGVGCHTADGDADENCDGEPDPGAEQKLATIFNNEVPMTANWDAGTSVARLWCVEVCTITVKIPQGIDWIYSVTPGSGDNWWLEVNNFVFTGMIEFPIEVGATIDLLVEGDGSKFFGYLLVLQGPVAFSAPVISNGVVYEGTFSTSLSKGSSSDATPTHYEVIRMMDY